MKAQEDTAVIARFPVSVNQQRCLVMEQVSPGTKGLNLAVRWEIRGAVPDDLVEEAFQRITDRHEILRSRFGSLDKDPQQEVLGHIAFRLARFDIRAMPGPDQEARIRAIAVEHAAERFELTAAGLMRVALVRTGQDRVTLLIAAHNSVFDGFSIGILGHEFGTILAALIAGEKPDLPPLPLQYGDYALWQQDLDRCGTLAAEAEIWADHLQGMTYFEVPGDYSRRRVPPASGSVGRDLPAGFEQRSAEAARQNDASVFALGTAAVTAALARFTGRQDVSYAIQIAGRDESDLEPLIGIFTNPLVCFAL
ncbi:condensation domain-containing protein [Gemmobacter sp. 24YEA27]|uniref:condensation domain-containing protein n=1 Tax=Gemmobacter sp. 24YEA27 TaxID=3040672 RepID=UPI0024B37BA9|nr:condensation domain-containing protein [Gemmobacter sp. 24YEA27]